MVCLYFFFLFAIIVQNNNIYNLNKHYKIKKPGLQPKTESLLDVVSLPKGGFNLDRVYVVSLPNIVRELQPRADKRCKPPETKLRGASA